MVSSERPLTLAEFELLGYEDGLNHPDSLFSTNDADVREAYFRGYHRGASRRKACRLESNRQSVERNAQRKE